MHSTNASTTFQGQRKPWRIAEATDPALARRLGDLPPLVADLLYRRGLRSAPEAGDFLDVAGSLLRDPGELPDMDKALERLARTKRTGETVAVYGDFDADGVTGTALMVKALERYGVTTVPYIPHRVTEGHGLNLEAVGQLTERGVGLIVTVDCGVTDVEAVAHARDLGTETIITDHHVVIEGLPDAAAVINPRAPHSTYGFDHLTGVGMALKLAHALLEPEVGESWAAGLLELAAVGTITDMAPLLDENRYIVHRGLEQLRKTESVGLQALMRSARIQPSFANAESVGFGIGPRLNAAGRLDHAMGAYELLMTSDHDRAVALVGELEAQNLQRRELTDHVLDACREQLGSGGPTPPVIMLGSADFNPGVVGLVAGRLADEFGVPALVYAQDGGQVIASCRSAPAFHWAEALAACGDLLARHGGHAQAAGFTCDASHLDALRGRLEAIAVERLPGPVTPSGSIEAEIDLRSVMGATLQQLQRMEPFGIGNPAPVFLTRGAAVESVSAMGKEGRHLRLKLRASGANWDAVAFNQSWVPGTERADIVYTIDIDTWNGTPRLRLTLLDYAPSS